MAETVKKFRKTKSPIQSVGGVCSGFAYYISCPVWVVRIIFVVTLLFTPWPIGSLVFVAYILLLIFLPEWEENPEDFYEVTGD